MEPAKDLCSRCEKNTPAKGHAWCTACKAELQKRYDSERHEMFERRGFAKGSAAMRELLASEFARLGNGMFSGDEVAGLILRVAIPAWAQAQGLGEGAGAGEAAAG